MSLRRSSARAPRRCSVTTRRCRCGLARTRTCGWRRPAWPSPRAVHRLRPYALPAPCTRYASKQVFFCLFALLACCTAGAVYPVRVKTWWLVGVVCFALLCLLACCTAGAVHAVRFKTWWLVGVVCLLCLLAAPPTPGTRYSIVVFGHSPTSHKSGTCVWLCPG